jgi:hypothetical protein
MTDHAEFDELVVLEDQLEEILRNGSVLIPAPLWHGPGAPPRARRLTAEERIRMEALLADVRVRLADYLNPIGGR